MDQKVIGYCYAEENVREISVILSENYEYTTQANASPKKECLDRFDCTHFDCCFHDNHQIECKKDFLQLNKQ